jgi:hypothetical protein
LPESTTRSPISFFLNDALPSTKQLAMAIRASTVSLKFLPVCLGSAAQAAA